MIDRNELRKLRDAIEEARIILTTTKLPDARLHLAKELIEAAVEKANAMLKKPTVAEIAQRQRTGVYVRE